GGPEGGGPNAPGPGCAGPDCGGPDGGGPDGVGPDGACAPGPPGGGPKGFCPAGTSGPRASSRYGPGGIAYPVRPDSSGAAVWITRIEGRSESSTPVKRAHWPPCPAGRPASAAASIASASPGVGYFEDHVCPGGRGEVYSAPVGRIHRDPGSERSRRACARQVTTGWEEPTFAQCTKKLGSVAA